MRAHLLQQDLIYVGGGSVICLLGVWRAHGLDVVLREAWEQGVALCGLSAGSLCWFAEGLTAFHAESRPIAGLGLLPCSNAVHYDQEKGRREAYHEAIAAGMPGGFAASDGAALHFVGDGLHRAVGSRPDAKAYRVEKVGGAGRRGRRSRSTTWGPQRPPTSLPPERARRAGRTPTILAMGGGGFTMEPDNPALDDFVLGLAARREPRICLLPTAGGDSEAQIHRYYATFGDRACEPTHVSLFRLGDEPGPAARAPAGAGRRSTSAAARWSTCSRSGTPRASTRSCARRGSAGSCSPA